MLKKIIAGLLSLCLVFSLAACSSKPADTNSGESGKESTETTSSSTENNGKDMKKIGLAMHNQTADWAVQFADTFKKEAKERGYEVVMTDANSVAADQVSQMEDLVAQNIGGLVVLPADYTALGQALKAASEAGVKIVNADSQVDEKDQKLVDVFVTADSFQGGYVVGEYLSEKLPKDAQVGEINYSQLSVIADRFLGMEKAFKDKGREDVTFVSKDATDLNAIAAYAEDMLIANPNMNAMVCLNDSSALTAFGAAKQLKKTDLMVFGFDGSPASKQSISAGEMSGTVVYSPVKLAEASLEAVIGLLEGKDVQKDTKVDMELINSENLKDYDIDSWN